MKYADDKWVKVWMHVDPLFREIFPRNFTESLRQNFVIWNILASPIHRIVKT